MSKDNFIFCFFRIHWWQDARGSWAVHQVRSRQARTTGGVAPSRRQERRGQMRHRLSRSIGAASKAKDCWPPFRLERRWLHQAFQVQAWAGSIEILECPVTKTSLSALLARSDGKASWYGRCQCNCRKLPEGVAMLPLLIPKLCFKDNWKKSWACDGGLRKHGLYQPLILGTVPEKVCRKWVRNIRKQ